MGKFKFEVIAGTHTFADTYEMVEDPVSKKMVPYVLNGIAQVKEKGKFYRKGDVFETDIDLLAPPQHYPQNEPKFRILSDPVKSMEMDDLERRKKAIEDEIAIRKSMQHVEPVSTVDYGATYEQMDLAELRQLAIDNEIPVGKAKTKEDFIKLLKEEDAKAAKV